MLWWEYPTLINGAKGAGEQTYDERRKEAKEARKAVVCNQPTESYDVLLH
jgi:hypothetical protein